MRPNPDRLLDPKIGDIVHNFLKDKHYLILNTSIDQDDEIKHYQVVHLESGIIEVIGYWDYLYKTSWEIVA